MVLLFKTIWTTTVLLSSSRILSSRGFQMASSNLSSSTITTDDGASQATCYVAMVTCPNTDVAKMLSRDLVKKKLVACVNIIPLVTSIYEWEGKVEEESESLMVIKTVQPQLRELIDYVNENHPYDVPEVISMKIEDGSKAYLDWIRKIYKKS